MDRTEVAKFWEANAEAWTRLARAGHDVYRDGLNTPAFLVMLPLVEGLHGIDIGCGEGANTRELAKRGARMCGIDAAPIFIRYACESEAAQPLGIRYQVADGQALPSPDAAFDFATAFMSLMDMPEQALALREAARVVRPGGFLQFSILHPCFAPPYRKVLRQADGAVRAIEVARYFEHPDGEIETWCFSAAPDEERQRFAPFQVPRFHRTLSEWIDMVLEAGFAIEKLSEPSATDEQVARFPALDDTRVGPLFLIVRARKV
jgi:ubiquinone/menaquinone biosynthesis C-methylase UbiE